MSDNPPADHKADKSEHKPKTPHGKYRIATAGDTRLDLGDAHQNLVIDGDGVQVTDAQFQAALELAGQSGIQIVELPQED